MKKYNEDLLNHLSAKYLGYMTLDAQKEVQITKEGFVYKGELIVSFPGLEDLLVLKTAPVVEEKKEEPKKEEVPEEKSETKEEVEDEKKEETEEKPEPVVSKKKPRKTK